MSGLREAFARTIGNHTVPVKAKLPSGELAFPASIHILIGAEEVDELADAVLRVLAEHGDTQQVREQVESLPGTMITVDQVMAVVAPHLIARDELIEQYKTLRQAFQEVSADEEHYATRAKEFLDRAERAEGAVMDREHYASLEQLAPGDRIVWTNGGQVEVLEVERIEPAYGRYSNYVLRWRDKRDGDVVNASVLVRRVERDRQTKCSNCSDGVIDWNGPHCPDCGGTGRQR
jgi:hypothetical protein